MTPTDDKAKLDENLGRMFCELGMPHDPDWNENITAGYAKQYEEEQQESEHS